MHRVKKWCGSPCDRRKDRGKVAIAAVAALCIFATATARASVVDLELVEDLSSLSYAGSSVFIPAVYGVGASLPYTAGTNFAGNGASGLLAHFKGHMYMSHSGGTGPSIDPMSQAPGFGAHYQDATGSGAPPWAMGSYIPGVIGTTPTTGGPIPGYPVTPAFEPGNYGISVPAIGAHVRQYNLSIGPTPLLGADGPMPLVGTAGPTGFYAMATQIWGMLSGYQALVSGLGGSFDDLSTVFSGAPFPVPLSGDFDARVVTLVANAGSPVYTPGAGVASWDGATLTIPVSGSVRYTIDDGDTPLDFSDDIDDTRVLSGMLVYHPYVPEPSSMILAGCGVVGLLGAAWRSRKRRPLAA